MAHLKLPPPRADLPTANTNSCRYRQNPSNTSKHTTGATGCTVDRRYWEHEGIGNTFMGEYELCQSKEVAGHKAVKDTNSRNIQPAWSKVCPDHTLTQPLAAFKERLHPPAGEHVEAAAAATPLQVRTWACPGCAGSHLQKVSKAAGHLEGASSNHSKSKCWSLLMA